MWKVMLADDEPYIREGMEKLVDWQAIDCEVVYSASNGKELLEEIKKCPPDIAIVDIKMPIMDGMKVAEYISEHNIETSIIFLTAYADFTYAQKAIHYGVSDYIIKTSALEEIPDAIERIRQKKNSKILKNCFMIRVSPIKQKDKMEFIYKHSFSSLDYKILASESSEGVIFITSEAGKHDEILQKCEKLHAFCKNFLGENPFIVCSGPHSKQCDVELIYEQMKEYAKKAVDSEERIFSMSVEEEEPPTLFHRVQKYIEEHCTEKITLTDIADAVHVSSGYVSRFYKKNAGENLFDTINSLRIKKAKELLEQSDKKIYEIAELTGFEDTAYFSKVFKKYVGYSPKEYEQMYGRPKNEK